MEFELTEGDVMNAKRNRRVVCYVTPSVESRLQEVSLSTGISVSAISSFLLDHGISKVEQGFLSYRRTEDDSR